MSTELKHIIDNFSTRSSTTGNFKIETICAKTMKISDSHEEHNMIMIGAKNIISRLFANMKKPVFIDKFILGTAGNKDGTILIPKDRKDGFIQDRTTLFSLISLYIKSGDIVNIIKNDYIRYSSPNGDIDGLYHYIGETTINMTMNDDIIVSDYFIKRDELPESYYTSFILPRTQIDETDGDLAESTNGAKVWVLLSGTSVTIKLELGVNIGNGSTGTMMYTEAGIFADEDIFCMKTFPAKIKDKTVILRIYWTINF